MLALPIHRLAKPFASPNRPEPALFGTRPRPKTTRSERDLADIRLRGAHKAPAMRLGAAPEQCRQCQNRNDLEAGDGPLISDAVAECVLNRICRRGEQNS